MSTNTNMRLLLHPGEAASLLAISERKLHRLTKSGVIPVVRIGVKGVRYSRPALERWVEEQQLEAAGQIMEAAGV